MGQSGKVSDMTGFFRQQGWTF